MGLGLVRPSADLCNNAECCHSSSRLVTQFEEEPPAAKGRRQGRAHAYNSREVRERERAWLA